MSVTLLNVTAVPIWAIGGPSRVPRDARLDALWILSAALFVGLLLVPLLDRSSKRDPRRRPFLITLGAVVLIGWIALTIIGAGTEVVSHVEME